MSRAMQIPQQQKNALVAAMEHPKTIETVVRVTGGDEAEARRLVASALLTVIDDPKLLSCEPTSVVRSVLKAAMVGADLSAGRGDGYLIPYGKQCTFIDGYQLWVRRAAEAGYEIVADAVYGESTEITGGVLAVTGGDWFRFRSQPPMCEHTPDPIRGEDARFLFGFAAARRGGSLVSAVIVRAEDIDKAAKGSRSPAWTEWGDRMRRRLPIKRLCRDLDLRDGPGLAKLIELDNLAAGGARFVPGIDDPAEIEPRPSMVLEDGDHGFGFHAPPEEAGEDSTGVDLPPFDTGADNDTD